MGLQGNTITRRIDDRRHVIGQVQTHAPNESLGFLSLVAANSTGDTETRITNANQSAARTFTLPNVASSDFVMGAGAQSIAGVKTHTDNVVLNTANLVIGDTDQLQLGDATGGDIAVQWDGSRLTSGPNIAQSTSGGLWSGCPSPIDPDPFKSFTFMDDFQNGVDTATNWILTTGAGGTISYDDTHGGILLVPTATTDNDHMGLATRSQIVNLVNTKAVWFEARFRLVEPDTNESAWWFGLSDTLTTGGFQANAAGPLASYDGILMSKDEGTMLIDAEASNASSQDTETNLGTFVTNTWTRVGFHITAAATTAVVHYYFNVDDSALMTAHSATTNLTRSGLQEMHLIFGVKAGPSASLTPLEVDYVKCVVER